MRNLFFVKLTISVLLFCSIEQSNYGQGLNLGMIDSSTSKTVDTFAKFMEYLEKSGFGHGKIIAKKTLNELVDLYKKNEVAFTFQSPAYALRLMDEALAEPVLIREKEGSKEYNGGLFVPAKSPIKTVQDLVGKVVAFEEPTSTSSFYLPMSIVLNAGIEVVEGKKPVKGKVAYYFSKNDNNTVYQVKSQLADAGGIKTSIVDKDPELRVLAVSPSVPRHIVVLSGSLDSETKEKFIKILLKMKDDPAAKEALTKAETPTGFSALGDGKIFGKQYMKDVVSKAIKSARDLVAHGDDK